MVCSTNLEKDKTDHISVQQVGKTHNSSNQISHCKLMLKNTS